MVSLQVSIDAAWLTPYSAQVFASELEMQLASSKFNRAWRRLREEKPLEFVTSCLEASVPHTLADLQGYWPHSLMLRWAEAGVFRLGLTGLSPLTMDELQGIVYQLAAQKTITDEQKHPRIHGDDLLEVQYRTKADPGRLVQIIEVYSWGFTGRTSSGYRSYRWEKVLGVRQARHSGDFTDLPIVTVKLSEAGKHPQFTCDVLLDGTYSFGE
jgi:hypothetical protein